ncbi:MAG: metal-dependent transcriptional regulator [Clostridia bacterium]|nr:metal-dependent transcriptional regulator [Clostridia bacterium]
MISKSLEEYLKTMYVLKKQNGNVRVTDIAIKMSCSKPSVNKALKVLKENELITYEAYGPIALTQSGEDLAKKILETYDIVYLFLKDVLNLPKEEAEKEAESLKLVMSDHTANRLAKYVHKTLDLDDLDCCYDVNQEKCRKCQKTTSRGKLIRKEKEE